MSERTRDDDTTPSRTGTAGDVEPRSLGAYLDDHLAGSVGGSQRFERLAEVLRTSPVGPALAEVARQVVEEREELRGVVQDLNLAGQNLPKQALVWVGERVSRLRAVGARLRRSPMATLLEVELLRAALVGKLGVWETLADLAPSLGLDAGRAEELRRRTLEQVATLDRVHEYVRRRALTTR